MNERSRWQDWVKTVVGLWFFVSPWVVGVTGDGTTSWNAWVFGLLIVIGSVLSLRDSRSTWQQWFVGLCGLWLVLAPAIVTIASEMLWTFLIVGIIEAVLSLWILGNQAGTAAKMSV